MGIGRKKITKGRLSSLQLLSSISWHLESHLGFVSSGLCLRSVWCANKEREGVREREWESEDVLIKGNSEGLNQIILHNLVREDTAFDTEKMEMTCPQRPIPMVWDESVVAKAIHFNHGDDDESGMFMTVCGPVQLSVKTMTLLTQWG